MNKERVIVMNGSRLLEKEDSQKQWKVEKVEQAGALRAGIYNIYNAQEASGDKSTEGIIVHSDKDFVYQMEAKNKFIKHSSKSFESKPVVGTNVSIEYTNKGIAQSVVKGVSRSRGR